MNADPRVQELLEFVAIPSVSAQAAHAADMGRCADWLVEKLRSLGLDARRRVGRRVERVEAEQLRALGNDKILGSVSRLVEAGHSVVFRKPELGSYIQNNMDGYRTYLRQQNGSYYLDLWVKKGPGTSEEQQQDFARRGM